MTGLHVVVYGQPHGQGSKKMVPGGRFVNDNDKRLRPWRTAIHHAALDALGDGPRPLFARDVPLEVAITFTFERAGGHFGTGRNANVLKPSAPAHFMKTPDVDKAIRAVLDALTTAGVWHDDRQVVTVTGRKVYATPTPSPSWDHDVLAVPGAVIAVYEIEP